MKKKFFDRIRKLINWFDLNWINYAGSKGQPSSLPVQRNAANARERARMRVLSSAFCRLKTKLPWVPADTKLSKLDTLRLATIYIQQLRSSLATGKELYYSSNEISRIDTNSPSGPSQASMVSLIISFCNFITEWRAWWIMENRFLFLKIKGSINIIEWFVACLNVPDFKEIWIFEEKSICFCHGNSCYKLIWNLKKKHFVFKEKWFGIRYTASFNASRWIISSEASMQYFWM